MASVANVAAYLSSQMNNLLNNSGGQVQTLPTVTQVGARERVFIAQLALASQASASLIAMARIPMGAALTSITEVTDTSLSTASISYGNASNLTKFSAVHTLTSTNAPAKLGLGGTSEGALGVPITTGYDSLTGNAVSYSAPGQGGALYDDIVMSVTNAALPASGNLTVIFEYTEPGS